MNIKIKAFSCAFWLVSLDFYSLFHVTEHYMRNKGRKKPQTQKTA